MLPNALIIGVQKSATSWLSARLSQHPDAYVVPGEVHYFHREQNYRNGVEWYSDLFPGARHPNVRCEKPGAYFWTNCEGVPAEPTDKPERIKAILPDVKLIVVLRDPIARAYSAWNHVVRAGRVRECGEAPDFFAPRLAKPVQRHGILTRGLYHAQLTRFLEIFDSKQILVLIQERDVIADPVKGMRKVCEFLDLNPDVEFSALREPENRFEGTRLGNRLAVQLSGPLHEFVHRIDRYLLTRLPLQRLAYPKGDPQTIAALADYFEDDCRRLREVVGPLPNNWLMGQLTQ